MPNNAEILAQLESLAEAAIAGATIHVECDGMRGMAFLNALKGADFPAILAAFKRLVKIEEAARVVDELTRGGFPKLAAALKEKANGQ